MIFTLDELVIWLGISVFEFLIHILSILVFTILLTMHIENNPTYISNLSPKQVWMIFTPLFTADALNAYYCFIVFVRTFIDRNIKGAFLGLFWSFFVLAVLTLTEYLLCHKLIGTSTLDYSEVFSPSILLLQLIAVRACQTH